MAAALQGIAVYARIRGQAVRPATDGHTGASFGGGDGDTDTKGNVLGASRLANARGVAATPAKPGQPRKKAVAISSPSDNVKAVAAAKEGFGSPTATMPNRVRCIFAVGNDDVSRWNWLLLGIEARVRLNPLLHNGLLNSLLLVLQLQLTAMKVGPGRAPSGMPNTIVFEDVHSSSLPPGSESPSQLTFEMDGVLQAAATQRDVWEASGAEHVRSVVEGYNATIFAVSHTAAYSNAMSACRGLTLKRFTLCSTVAPPAARLTRL
jgi:hypothetical protein